MARKSNPVYYDVVCVICGNTATRTAKNGTPKTCGDSSCVKENKKRARKAQNAIYRQTGQMQEWNRKSYLKNKPDPKPKQIKWSSLKEDMACLNAVVKSIKQQIMIRDHMKQCSKCKKIKSDDNFRPVHNGNGRLQSWCRPCEIASAVDWKRRNQNKVKGYVKTTIARIKTDPERHLKTKIRGRINKAIKAAGHGGRVKGGKLRYLGCTAAEAVTHIERQMNSRMTWDNYGRAWHIDHVMPCAAYDLSKEEDRRKAFHYTNLQPLWARANHRKGDRITKQTHQPELILANT